MHKFENMQCLDSALNTGAFIVSGDNVMTASWGFVGVMWGKKVFVAPIRDSRYTKEFIDSTGVFTVSIPKSATMSAELKFCGTKSGREYDKWAETGMKKVKAKSVDTCVVDGCERYLECRVLSVLPMGDMDLSGLDKWYPTHDMHNFYFGEIIEEY